MNSTTTQSLACSLFLHGACAAILFTCLAAPIQQLTPSLTPLEHFEIVPSVAPSSEISSHADSQVDVRMPDLPPLPKTPVQPAQQATVSTQPTTTVRPTRLKPASIASAPNAEHAIIAPPQNRHGTPSQSTKQPAKTPSSDFRRINPSDFTYRAPSSNATSTDTSSGESDLGEEFTSELLSELRRSYTDRDVAFAGLATEVEFALTDSGRLNSVRILDSSGSAEFDQAVLSALQRVRLSKVPASAVGKPFKTRFKVPNS